MAVRADVHDLVDRLPEAEIQAAMRFLEYLADGADTDDEALSADEEVALSEGLAALRRGDVLTLDEALPPRRDEGDHPGEEPPEAHASDETRIQLLADHLSLVRDVVQGIGTSAHDAQDLIAIGALGLIKAVDSFVPGGGGPFAAFARRCIENEIQMFRSWRGRPQRGGQPGAPRAGGGAL